MRIENTNNANNTNANNPQLDPEEFRQREEEFRARQRDMDRIDAVRRQYENISVSDQILRVQRQLSNLQPNETQRRVELQQRLDELRSVWRILHL